jgi:glutamate decarboxylase
LVWDFRLERVQSINASGHKYGLVYPGVGWAVWRDKAALPEDLIFEVDYLGGRMPTFALNFSRGGAQIVAQYYELIRLGREGFRRVQQDSRDTAMWLASQVSELNAFRLISDGGELPVFAFTLRPEVEGFTVFDVSDALRVRGWIVPAYPMPPAIDDLAVLRVCVRNGFSRDLAALLLADLEHALTHVATLAGHLPVPNAVKRAAFHH